MLMSKSFAPLVIGAAMIALALVWVNRPRPEAPPVFDSATLSKSDTAPSLQELNVIAEQAAAGFDVAQNNLAVIALRSPRGLVDVNVETLLDKAAAQGNMAARYNRALLIPNKFKTDPALIQRRIDLLMPNAEAGDPHSQVLLAKTLGYTNRDAQVTDRGALQLEMYRRAADSGDVVYQLLYGKALYSAYRHTEDPALWQAAVDTLYRVHLAGDGRGAEHLGFIMRSPAPLPRHPAEAFTLRDPLPHYRAAADLGLATAACGHGIMAYRPVQSLLPDFEGTVKHVRRQLDKVSQTERSVARENLAACANLERRPRAPFYDASRRQAFGAPSVYRRKQTAGWPSLAGQNDLAAVILGLMHLHGLDVPQDHDKATALLSRAATRSDHAGAQQILDSLQSQ
jgi:TPR repeat protein